LIAALPGYLRGERKEGNMYIGIGGLVLLIVLLVLLLR
jgi:hypothetical protein